MTTSKAATSNTDEISHYSTALAPELAAVCDTLRQAISTALPQATSKLWHAIPVWFIGENPIVGYTAKAGHVSLMFWNGQAFDEPALRPVGKFVTAEIRYADASQIDLRDVGRWLEKAGSDVWDMMGLRQKTLEAKRSA